MAECHVTTRSHDECHDDECHENPQLCGHFDAAERARDDSPLHGDLHERVPGPLVVLRGPQDLGGAERRDDAAGRRRRPSTRTLSGILYADALRDRLRRP